MMEYKGKSVFEGIAIGKVHILTQQKPVIDNHKVVDVAGEIQSFQTSVEAAISELNELMISANTTQKEILDVHVMMLSDPDFTELCEAKLAQGYNASYAVLMASNELSKMFKSMDDAYMQARANDVQDISTRVINHLNGVRNDYELKEDTILLANDITPSELISYPRETLKGIVTYQGSVASHVAIISRGMSLPLIVDTKTNIDSSYEGKKIIMDGFKGLVILDPTEEVYASYAKHLVLLEEENEKRKLLKGQENETLDGKKIDVFCNIGKSQDVNKVLQEDGGGIGLFRSEFLYLDTTDYPTEEYQFLEYKKVLLAMGEKPVIIRTMDIGADKMVDYFQLPKEDNPALGLRSLRICLKRPHIMKTQLRALYRASAFGNLKIMVPMIISVQEVMWVKNMAKEVMDELTKENIPFDEKVELGIMIETPAAAIISDELADICDFFSIGTNDLTQYTLAIDRQNQSLDDIFNPKHKAVLRLIKMACDNAHARGKWCGICGELARNVDLTGFFVGIGIDELSVSAPYVLKLRERIRALDTTKIDIESFIK